MIGPGELLLLAAPALAAVLLAAVAGWIGWKLGRSVAPGGWREIERGLRQMLAGRSVPEIEVPDDDPAAPAARLLLDLARDVRDRVQRAERKGAILGEAVEGFPGLGVAVVDRDLVIVSAGESLAAMLGERPIDLEGRKLDSVMDEAGFRELAVRLVDREARSAGFEVRLRMRRVGDGEVPVRVRGADIPGHPGRLALVVEPVAEEDPAVAGARAAALVAGLPAGILVVAGGRVREANPAAVGLLGEDPTGRPLADLFATAELLLALDRVGRAERGERVPPFRARFHGAGRLLDVVPIPLPGDPPAAGLVLEPAASATPARRGAADRVPLALEALPDGLVLFSPAEGGPPRAVLVTARAAELLGVPRQELLGLPPGEFAARVALRFAEPLPLVELLSGEGRDAVLLATRETPPRRLELAVAPVPGEGAGRGRLLVVRDVTGQREEAEELAGRAAEADASRDRLQQAYEELAAAHRQLEARLDRLAREKRALEDRDRERSELFGEISHELQTPLVSIRGYTQMILEGRLGRVNDEQRRGLEVTLRNVDRMVEMIDNLLALARADRGGEPELEEVEVEPVVREVVDRHQGAARARGVSLEVHLEAPGARVLAERDGFERVLDNLVGNAVKFDREGGRVDVTVRQGRAPGFLEVEVADDGPGIPEDERERIFERFWRGRGSAGVPGSGIGLATVKSLVERHGGWIAVDSRPGEGSRFTFAWPTPAARSAGAAPTPPAS